MDPISHGLIGIGISAFSGQSISINSAVTIGSMLGAMAPDLDFVVRLWKDDASYLKHHRGLSHSVPFLGFFSLGITLILSQVGFSDFNFLTVLLWSFLGGLSHTLFDILNSYGAKLFKQKRKGNLLTLYDPVVTMVVLYLIFNGQNSVYQLINAVLLTSVYLMVRNYLKYRASQKLHEVFASGYAVEEVVVMPSLKAFYKWDYIIHTKTHDIVGQYNPFKRRPIYVGQTLERVDDRYCDRFKTSELGKVFGDFSPNLHVSVLEEGHDTTTLRICDLRYFFKNEFLHQATMVLDKDMNIISAVLHPYKLDKAIPVMG